MLVFTKTCMLSELVSLKCDQFLACDGRHCIWGLLFRLTETTHWIYGYGKMNENEWITKLPLAISVSINSHHQLPAVFRWQKWNKVRKSLFFSKSAARPTQGNLSRFTFPDASCCTQCWDYIHVHLALTAVSHRGLYISWTQWQIRNTISKTHKHIHLYHLVALSWNNLSLLI